MAVLEAVIRQTGLYARKGRLGVFWGDQVFLPSAPFDVTPTHHIDILCTLLPKAPTAQEWQDQGLDKYGVIAVMGSNNNKTVEAAQVEKVSHETATRMLQALGTLQQVGPSLGSFSVSSVALNALLTEYDTELQQKTAKLDTDPHFWMPLTLSLQSYVELMKQKGTDGDAATAHYERMAALKRKFLEQTADDSLGLFGAVNVGKEACWWDYGQLKLYSQNSLLLLDPAADLLRKFLDCENEHILSSKVPSAAVDAVSYVIASQIGDKSKVSNSLVAGVACPELTCDGAIVVNCVAKKISAQKGAILYNLMDDSDEGLVVEAGQVHVGLSRVEQGQVKFDKILQSRMDIDGGKAWKKCLEMNELSFEDVNKQNKEADIGMIARKRQATFKQMAEKMGL